jgi:hypothetical protein
MSTKTENSFLRAKVVYGILPRKMLTCLGFTEKMIKKIPALFFRNGFDKFKMRELVEKQKAIRRLTFFRRISL